MKYTRQIAKWCAATVALACATATGYAVIAYDDSVNDLKIRFNPGTLEVGNEITLAPLTPRNLFQFDFEFWGDNANGTFDNDVTVTLKFYKNDGPVFDSTTYQTPSTLIWADTPFNLKPGTTGALGPLFRKTLTYTTADFGTILLPDVFTWTVQFSGMSANDTAGVDLYAPPVIGSSFDDYWENSGTWKLKTNSLSASMSFGAKVTTVPESGGTFWLLPMGLLGLGMVHRLLRRKQNQPA